MAQGHLILDGDQVPVPFPVRHNERWHFRMARRKRKKPPQFGVLHHQGGEGGAGTLWRVLRKRGYSVHFGVDYKGVLTQYSDPMRWVTFHAGAANDYSWGVEIANRALPPAQKVKPRVSYVDEVHGREINFLKFTPQQVWKVHQLCAAMEEHAGTPIMFPMEPGSLRPRVLRTTFEDWREWRGLLCHYHLVSSKIDPVPHLADDLVYLPDAGWSL